MSPLTIVLFVLLFIFFLLIALVSWIVHH